VAFNPQANYANRGTAAADEVSADFCVVSATDSSGRPLISGPKTGTATFSSNYPRGAELSPFQTHCFSEDLVAVKKFADKHKVFKMKKIPHSIGQCEARQEDIKRLKFGGGQVYNRKI
jgi:hypothetical protein